MRMMPYTATSKRAVSNVRSVLISQSFIGAVFFMAFAYTISNLKKLDRRFALLKQKNSVQINID